MPTIDEAVQSGKTELASDLAAGIEAISYNQSITFVKYTRAVLPLDGYLFWVKATPEKTINVKGSLHYASDTIQNADGTFALNRVVFTAEKEVEDFNNIAPNVEWICSFQKIRFSFNSRSSFYKQADVYHYHGDAIYPDMATQVIDSAADLHPERVIVSNSLPIWLGINGYNPPNSGAGFAMPAITMYPAYLIPPNIVPPFASIDIDDGLTEGVAAAPTLQSDSSHYQLTTDRVKITLWGLRNDEAMQFIDCINAYSLAYNWFGIMNIPIIRDEKRTQSELNTLAMKKSVTFEISYYQYQAREIARQLIEQARTTFIIPGT